MYYSKIISKRTNPTRRLVFILTLLGILFSKAVFGQEESYIQTQEDYFLVYGGIKFYQNYEKLTGSELKAILKSTKGAFEKFQTGRINSTVGWILHINGAILLFMGDSYAKMGVGAAIAIGGGVLVMVSRNQKMAAVNIYNRSLSKQVPQKELSLKLGLTNSGVGLSFTF
jgi:hypothetical protein